MSELPLSPPILLLVVGLPGSGKSFFARQFSEMYDLPYISEDRLRYELFENASFSESEQQVVHNVSRLMLDTCLKTGKSLIYEVWDIPASERYELAKILHKIGYKLLIVWVQSDEQTALQRAGKRDRRRPDDKYSHDVSKTVFDGVKRRFQKPTDKENCVVISGKFAFTNQQRAVVRKLVNIYGGETLSQQTRPLGVSRIGERVLPPTER